METAREIALTRLQAGATGDVFWRAAFILRGTNGVAAALARAYASPALVPPSPWLGETPAGKPLLYLRSMGRATSLSWKPSGGGQVWQWFIQQKFGGNWRAEILPASQTNLLFNSGGSPLLPQAVAVTAVTRFGHTSPAAVAELEPH